MKKTILVLSFIIAAASYSFAGTGAPTGGTFTFKVSNNVSVAYYTDATTKAQAYVANTTHSSGDRIYSSSNATSNIWYKVVTVGTAATTGTTTAGESTYSGWSSQ